MILKIQETSSALASVEKTDDDAVDLVRPVQSSPARPFCQTTASGRPMLVSDEPVPPLAASLAALFVFGVARSSSVMDAVRSFGLASPRELHRLARRFKVRLPWRSRKARTR